MSCQNIISRVQMENEFRSQMLLMIEILMSSHERGCHIIRRLILISIHS